MSIRPQLSTTIWKKTNKLLTIQIFLTQAQFELTSKWICLALWEPSHKEQPKFGLTNMLFLNIFITSLDYLYFNFFFLQACSKICSFLLFFLSVFLSFFPEKQKGQIMKYKSMKIPLPHSISQKNVRYPPEVREGDQFSGGDQFTGGDQFRGGELLRLRKGSPPEIRKGDPL